MFALKTAPRTGRASPRGKCTQGADRYRVIGSIPAHVFKGVGQRAVGIQLVVRHHERQGS